MAGRVGEGYLCSQGELIVRVRAYVDPAMVARWFEENPIA